jgi:hypothetical protein
MILENTITLTNFHTYKDTSYTVRVAEQCQSVSHDIFIHNTKIPAIKISLLYTHIGPDPKVYIAFGSACDHTPLPQDIPLIEDLIEFATHVCLKRWKYDLTQDMKTSWDAEKKRLETYFKTQPKTPFPEGTLVVYDSKKEHHLALSSPVQKTADMTKTVFICIKDYLVYGSHKHTIHMTTLGGIGQSLLPLQEGISFLKDLSSHDKISLLNNTHQSIDDLRTYFHTKRNLKTPKAIVGKGAAWYPQHPKDPLQFSLDTGTGIYQDGEAASKYLLNFIHPTLGRVSLQTGYGNSGLRLTRGVSGNMHFKSEKDADKAAYVCLDTLIALNLLPSLKYFPRQIINTQLVPSHIPEHFKEFATYLLGYARETAIRRAKNEIAKRKKEKEAQAKAAGILKTLPTGMLMGTHICKNGSYISEIRKIKETHNPTRSSSRELKSAGHFAQTFPLTKKWVALYPPLKNKKILNVLSELGYSKSHTSRLEIEASHRASLVCESTQNPMENAQWTPHTYFKHSDIDLCLSFLKGDDNWSSMVLWPNETSKSLVYTIVTPPSQSWSFSVDIFNNELDIFIRPPIYTKHYELEQELINIIIDIISNYSEYTPYKDQIMQKLPAEINRLRIGVSPLNLT